MQDAKHVVDALAALAQEHRLALFRLLVHAGERGLAAGAIAESVGVPASSLSFHLAHMERAGIIIRTRAGRSLFYSANYAAMNALMAYLTENCCEGSAACVTVPVCEAVA